MPYRVFSPLDKDYKGLLDLRLRLLNNGFEPIPIVAAEKRPLIDRWSSGDITVDRIVELSRTPLYNHEGRALPDHLSTGLRTGHLAAVDIDLHDRVHAEAIRIMVEDFLGPTPLWRVGSKGYMLSYWNPGTTIGKTQIRADGKTLVEVFGQGNQYVAFGVHPTTKRPYEWVNGYDPLTLRLDQLPTVTAQQLRELHALLITWLGELDYAVRGSVHEDTGATPRKPLGDLLDAASVTDLFLHLMPGDARRASSGFYNFRCPADHRHLRSGIAVHGDGGLRFKCFNSACTYHDATGWSPGGGIGPRLRDLYVLMGGDPDDLPANQYEPYSFSAVAYSCAEEMIADRGV